MKENILFTAAYNGLSLGRHMSWGDVAFFENETRKEKTFCEKRGENDKITFLEFTEERI